MGKIITVCGGHGSGKTTVAANLGYILSQNNLVGILSTNMVYGSIQHLFGTVIDDCHGLYEMS
ncbi:MAG: cobalamin biosynthesis protein CobQ, partial [Clostridia bacterium]|nr:cobalamin biosynthesis protein CobQ [Clostridia bacterium]